MSGLKFFTVAAIFSVLAACGGEDDASSRRVAGSPAATTPAATFDSEADGTASPSATPRARSSARVSSTTPPPATAGSEPGPMTLTEVTRARSPVALRAPAGDDAVYIVEKGGRIRVLRNGRLESTALDISGEVSTGGEQGLLGLAFSRDRSRIYVNFTNGSGDTVVREYAFSNRQADVGSARTVLTQDQPFANHNGGHLAFGPDGFLYIALGDGGSGGDPQDNAQDLGTWLGKMLRIDPRPDGDAAYRVPDDNPFVGREGARPEIWSYGLRNPWRYSFDRSTGDLWIGDVGQNAIEEVDFQPSSSKGGENYGWNRFEGTRRFEGDPPRNHTPPVYEYERASGACAVTGGYVYRGSKMPGLRGWYVFADYCDGRVRAFRLRDGRATDHRFLGPQLDQLSSFGEDASGELYAISLEGPVMRLDPA